MLTPAEKINEPIAPIQQDFLLNVSGKLIRNMATAINTKVIVEITAIRPGVGLLSGLVKKSLTINSSMPRFMRNKYSTIIARLVMAVNIAHILVISDFTNAALIIPIPQTRNRRAVL